MTGKELFLIGALALPAVVGTVQVASLSMEQVCSSRPMSVLFIDENGDAIRPQPREAILLRRASDSAVEVMRYSNSRLHGFVSCAKELKNFDIVQRYQIYKMSSGLPVAGIRWDSNRGRWVAEIEFQE